MRINFYFSNKDLTGGHLYDLQVFEVLKKSGFNIHLCNVYTPYRGRGHTYIDGIYSCLISSSKRADIDIFDYTKSIWCTNRNKAGRIIIFHHYDPKENNKEKKYESNFKKFLKNAKNATVVVVSEYWKAKLSEYGLKNIHVIYNSFDPDIYQDFIPRDEFRKKYNLPDKPILYIGKNSKAKTLHTYNQLKALEKDYLLITSGPGKEFDGPIFLKLTTRDYISLLHNSTACLLFTDFIEGWSRIAHESILCGTPIIGNGSGGMNELLQLTNQIIMPGLNPEKLEVIIEGIKNNSIRVSVEDINKIKRFNLLYFSQSWYNLINEYDCRESCI